MISVDEALAQVLNNLDATGVEQVALPEALNRVLAADVTARLTQPFADVSSMDGYAVIASDGVGKLDIVGESPAGGCFDGTLTPGQAVRIFTGAPVPNGADAIVMQENTTRAEGIVDILQAAPKGQFIRPAGLDFKAGNTLLKAGRCLTPRNLGLIAAANVPWVNVKRRPRVAIIATGNEVVMPGNTVGDNQIISSNSVMLSAYVKTLGAEPLDLGIARDDEGSLTDLIQSATGADLVVTIGGASVGDYDFVNQVLDKEGVDLGFYKVAMRPGKPLIFGHLNGVPVLGLPGNPVSVGVTSALFLRPAILAMMGLDPAQTLETAVLGADLGANDGRQDYLRATLLNGVATPFSKQDSSMLARFSDADCLVIRAPQAPAINAGDRVEVIRL